MNSIYYSYNVDAGGNLVSVNIPNEQKQVSPTESTIQLEQVPDEAYRIVVTNSEGGMLTEVFNRDEVIENTFYCDYATGKVYFHNTQQGKIKIINYYGRGIELLSAERIYDAKASNGRNVIATLQELIDLTREYIAILGTFEEAQVVIAKLERNIEDGNVLNTDLENNIAIATPIKNQLSADISEAKKWKDQLTTDVSDGKILQPLLNENVVDAKKIQPLLENNITVATPLQENLRADIEEASIWKDKLSQDVSDGKVLSPELSNLISEGNSVKENLENSLLIAQDDIDKIEASGNFVINVMNSEWVLKDDIYEKEITHDLYSENIHLTARSLDAKEAFTIGYQIVDKSKILLKSDSNISISVVLSASYYKATITISDDIAEEVVLARGDMPTLDSRLNKITEQVEELFTDVSNGKTLVANAITDKGIIASSEDTFNQLATKIGEIKTGIEATVDGEAYGKDINLHSTDSYIIDSFSTLPYNCSGGSSVVFNGELHIFGGYGGSKKHYKYSTGEWVEVSTLPFSLSDGVAIVYNNEIHILGGTGNHYKFDGVSSWTKASTYSYEFKNCCAIVLNNEMHLLGISPGNLVYTYHHKFNGSSWRSVSVLPYDLQNGGAVLIDNEIHILGSSNGDNGTKHYKYSSGSWSEVSTLPYKFSYGQAVMYKGNVHILGGSTSVEQNHYEFKNGEWVEAIQLPYKFKSGVTAIMDNEVHLLSSSVSGCTTNHYKTYTLYCIK